jgi:hypothetical protein
VFPSREFSIRGILAGSIDHILVDDESIGNPGIAGRIEAVNFYNSFNHRTLLNPAIV